MTRVLLITTGGTPQLVTETVYALLNPAQGEAWVPDRIILATTSVGETLYITGKNERTNSFPLVGGEGRLMSLYRALGREADHIEPEILVAQLPSGEKIRDVRSPLQVEAYAQMLLENVMDLTSDGDVELHLSIAGGRKTMSFIAGQIMTMCGRARDVMSHCLIEPDTYETRGDFWWPGNDGDIGTMDAKIELHGVPFVRLHHYINVRTVFRGEKPNYSVGVERTNHLPETERLCVNFRDRSISVGRDRLILAPKNFGLFSVIALAKKWDIVLSIQTFDDSNCQLRFAYAASQALCALPSVESGVKDMDDVIEEFRNANVIAFRVISSNLSKVLKLIETEFSRTNAAKILEGQYGVGAWTNFAGDKIDLILPDGFDFSLYEKQDPNFMLGFR